jgi:uncharacterized protein (DUF433 family)
MDLFRKLQILGFEDDTEFMAILPEERREVPLYSVPDSALYLHIPEKTLRSWLFGRPYPRGGGTAISRPLIEPADPSGNRLSFYNLVEAHILKSTRTRDEVPMSAIRDAIDWAIPDAPKHPLISRRFLTEGSALFEQKLGELINASKHGQVAFHILEPFLDRIDRDSTGDPSALYPFIPSKPASKVVVIKPGISSGVPTIAHTGISIPILYGRFKAGDSIADLSDDYSLKAEEVEDAIAYLDTAA